MRKDLLFTFPNMILTLKARRDITIVTDAISVFRFILLRRYQKELIRNPGILISLVASTQKIRPSFSLTQIPSMIGAFRYPAVQSQPVADRLIRACITGAYRFFLNQRTVASSVFPQGLPVSPEMIASLSS